MNWQELKAAQVTLGGTLFCSVSLPSLICSFCIFVTKVNITKNHKLPVFSSTGPLRSGVGSWDKVMGSGGGGGPGWGQLT